MNPNNVHTVPWGSRRWANKRPFENGARQIFRTQRAAIRAGARAARQAGSEHFIHRRDGRIRARNSYGRDLNPPKG